MIINILLLLFCFSRQGLTYVIQASLELAILLLLPPESLDYRHVTLRPAQETNHENFYHRSLFL
jgi:hypothetical protein